MDNVTELLCHIFSQEPASKKQAVVAKNGTGSAPPKKGKEASSSDSSDTDSEDEVSIQVILRASRCFFF
jgi:hypothetical protein